MIELSVRNKLRHHRTSDLKAVTVSNDPSACFSPRFVAEFESAVLVLPPDHHRITWANSEKGLVAALLGPAKASFVVGLEEAQVMLIDKKISEKLRMWPVEDVTGSMVVALIKDVLEARPSQA